MSREICHAFLSLSSWRGSVHTELIKHISYDAGALLMFLVEYDKRHSDQDGWMECNVRTLETHTLISKYRQKNALKELSIANLAEISYQSSAKKRKIRVLFDNVVSFFVHDYNYREQFAHTPHAQNTELGGVESEILKMCALIAKTTESQIRPWLDQGKASNIIQLFYGIYHGQKNGIKYILRWFEKSRVFDDDGIFVQGQYPNEYDIVQWFAMICDEDREIVQQHGKFIDLLFTNIDLLFDMRREWYAITKSNKSIKENDDC